MSVSDSSSLSSPPSSDNEADDSIMPQPTGLNRYFKPAPKSEAIKAPSSPPLPKRPASPPHEYVLADNADIALIVMFRSRFNTVFPKSLPHYGPQDIENGVTDPVPGDHIERLLCALLGLVLNRKKEVERGHFGRALEEAISTHSSQWPPAWKDKNPLHGGGNFANMTPVERITLLKTLILWSLAASDAVQAILKESYKQSRHEDDKNQPLSVQAWGRDGYKRNYWLVEGQDDTHFRVYRENNGATAKTNTWFSVAGNIEEVTKLADKLDEENTPHARTLRDRVRAAIPRFEAGEEKRRRRNYRLARKAAFTRPEPGFSLYEGRTRGKRMRYTYSEEDDDDDGSDAMSSRRSTRPSGVSTPAEHAGPTVTASGRQVKTRLGGMYGETILVDQRKEIENERALATSQEPESNDGDEEPSRRPRRTGRQAVPSRRQETNGDDGDLEDESEAESTGDDWSGNEDEADEPEPEPDFEDADEDDELSVDGSEIDDIEVDEGPPKSLVVQLRYEKKRPKDLASNGLSSHLKPEKVDLGQGSQNSLAVEALKPVMPTVEPSPSYPSTSLPHHFSPASHSQSLANGKTSSEPHERTSEKRPEQPLYQQPPALQHSRVA